MISLDLSIVSKRLSLEHISQSTIQLTKFGHPSPQDIVDFYTDFPFCFLSRNPTSKLSSSWTLPGLILPGLICQVTTTCSKILDPNPSRNQLTVSIILVTVTWANLTLWMLVTLI